MKTQLLALLLVLVVAFSATSYSYACLTVKPQPGNFNIEFTAASAEDNEKTYNAAEVKTQISPDRNFLYIKICNAYPGYQATIMYTIENTGKIPVQFYAPSISNPNPQALQVSVTSHMGVVLRQGQTVQGCLTVLVLESAQENQQYCFEVKNVVTQK